MTTRRLKAFTASLDPQSEGTYKAWLDPDDISAIEDGGTGMFFVHMKNGKTFFMHASGNSEMISLFIQLTA